MWFRLEDVFLLRLLSAPHPAAPSKAHWCRLDPFCGLHSLFIFPRSTFPTVRDGPNYIALRGSLLSPPLLDVKQIQKLKHAFL